MTTFSSRFMFLIFSLHLTKSSTWYIPPFLSSHSTYPPNSTFCTYSVTRIPQKSSNCTPYPLHVLLVALESTDSVPTHPKKAQICPFHLIFHCLRAFSVLSHSPKSHDHRWRFCLQHCIHSALCDSQESAFVPVALPTPRLLLSRPSSLRHHHSLFPVLCRATMLTFIDLRFNQKSKLSSYPHALHGLTFEAVSTNFCEYCPLPTPSCIHLSVLTKLSLTTVGQNM